MIKSSTPKQRQLIGILRKQLALDEDTYKEMLEVTYGVTSSKNLSKVEAEELLQSLKQKAIEMGLYHSKTGGYYHKYDNMAGRCGMGTPAQLRKIDVMWKNVSRQKTNSEKEKALNTFIKRITGKERLNFLTQSDVSKVIKAIETIQKQQNDRKIEENK